MRKPVFLLRSSPKTARFPGTAGRCRAWRIRCRALVRGDRIGQRLILDPETGGEDDAPGNSLTQQAQARGRSAPAKASLSSSARARRSSDILLRRSFRRVRARRRCREYFRPAAEIALIGEADAVECGEPLLDRLARGVVVGDLDLVEAAGQRLRKLVRKQRARRAQRAAKAASREFSAPAKSRGRRWRWGSGSRSARAGRNKAPALGRSRIVCDHTPSGDRRLARRARLRAQ